jgi:formylglycine-generating enzyme required for sulfatase activity
MVVVPSGSFVMGGGDAKAKPIELPRHEVTLARPFAVGKTHVTRAQFMAFVAETPTHDVGPCFSGDLDLDASKSGDHPVVCVNYADADAYIRWLSTKTRQPYRLLTESEFEYAARARTVTEWFWGDKRTDAKAYAHCADCGGNFGSVKATAPAGSLKPNAFGLYDMSGNAYQLVQDCYQANYNGAPTDGLARGGSCILHVIRGGSWQKTMDWGRSASRFLQSPDMRTNEVGFRVARTLR